MYRVALGKAVLSDARFGRLMDATGWGRAQTVGVLMLLWWHTRDRSVGRQPSKDVVLRALPFSRQERDGALMALEDAGYVQVMGEVVHVLDNDAYFDASDKMSEAGKRGGYPKHKPAASKKPRTNKPKPVPSAASEVWAAYAAAYAQRYGTEPVRNARVNAQLAQLVHRVGKEESQELARFFVAHDSAFYVRRQHAVGDMLHQCESLVTQMRRGQPFTEHQERAHGEAGRMAAQLQRLGGVG